MNKGSPSNRPIRKQLDHSIHFHARFGATYFITICCEHRGMNQLCRPDTAQLLIETARQYRNSEQWYVKVLLLMPDHLHMLVGVGADASLSKLIRDFKRNCGTKRKNPVQRNFFDHRLRHDESETEKYDYICENPVRAGLVNAAEYWPYAFIGE